MTHPFPVVFIGPMAAGKTKVGKRVARALGVPFTDTDKRVVADHGPIADIFAEHGAGHFRRLERQAVIDALADARDPGGVVSLGGGAVLDAATRADLSRCSVVYLTVAASAVATRIGGTKRPLLAGGIEDWQRIFDERRPLYEQLASIRFDTSTRPLDAIAADIATWVRGTS